jgi:pyruvate dehydrogenase complex dehydrogenase (E1) component
MSIGLWTQLTGGFALPSRPVQRLDVQARKRSSAHDRVEGSTNGRSWDIAVVIGGYSDRRLLARADVRAIVHEMLPNGQ